MAYAVEELGVVLVAADTGVRRWTRKTGADASVASIGDRRVVCDGRRVLGY